MSINWNDLKAAEIAVNCKTKEEVQAFLKECVQNNVQWIGDAPCTVDYTVDFSEESCYAMNYPNCGISHADMSYWKQQGHTIVGYRAEKDSAKLPIKLYCIKDLEGQFTKGKIYEIGLDGRIEAYDNSFRGVHQSTSFADYKAHFPHLAERVVPLVEREAKVGDYIYIRYIDPVQVAFYHYGYKVGDVFQVKEMTGYADGCVKSPYHVVPREYLVLEGYKPEHDTDDFDWDSFIDESLFVSINDDYCKKYSNIKLFLEDVENRFPCLRWPDGDKPTDFNPDGYVEGFLVHNNMLYYACDRTNFGNVDAQRHIKKYASYPPVQRKAYQYKIGETAKVIANNNESEFSVGEIVVITALDRNGSVSTAKSEFTGEWAIDQEGLEPWANPNPRKKEEKQSKKKNMEFNATQVKLYCTADAFPFLTKGNVYEFVDGDIQCDMGGHWKGTFDDYADFREHNRSLANCLVPLASRRANVGDWIYVHNASLYSCNDYKNGDVYLVRKSDKDVVGFGDCEISHTMEHREYLVLERLTEKI